MSNTTELPVGEEFVSLRRCSNVVGEDDQSRVCGWHVFDPVVLLADVSAEAPSHQSGTLSFDALACRSCGAVQPDGLPVGLLGKL